MNYIDNTQRKKLGRIKINRLNKKYINQELIESNSILSNINGYSLDKEQRKAIITDECANLIVAGAGSGKSLTMVGKIRYLIERKVIKEDEILCISFTREASENLENSIKKNYNYNIKVYTFHKLALEFLKNNNYKISNDNLLRYIVDEYFYFIMYDNNIRLKVKKILNKIDTPYQLILKSKDLENLKRLIITFINLFKTNNYNITYFLKIKGNKDILRIIIDIYILYEEELKSRNKIDFNDMIVLATKYVKYNNIKKYKYIIVDEYQDTSYIRYLFLKEIINKTNAKIVCVGDDYQSIYRFNGCNLNVFLNFKKYFGYTKVLKINNTYRNSQELINVAGKFIMKNKRQLYKKLRSNKRIEKPIKIMYGNNLNKLLDKVIENHKNILILGRNNYDINKYFKVNEDNKIDYKGVNIKYLTIHASKGLEEECVVIINLRDDILGIPNKIKDDNILKSVNNNKDIYPFEEERRLFYVALTRTKSDVYLLVDKKKPSIFIKELIKDSNKYIEYI
ncbi:MAG: UvrD-helicase domain-containing protein [Bacilli bacterium]|nr:UvrD-helicase domain-containing protein [Bacilli bacterium]